PSLHDALPISVLLKLEQGPERGEIHRAVSVEGGDERNERARQHLGRHSGLHCGFGGIIPRGRRFVVGFGAWRLHPGCPFPRRSPALPGGVINRTAFGRRKSAAFFLT